MEGNDYWIIGFGIRPAPGATVRWVSKGYCTEFKRLSVPRLSLCPIRALCPGAESVRQAPERRRRSKPVDRRSESGRRRSGYATYKFGGSPDSPGDSENSASGVNPILALTLFNADSIHARRLIVPSLVIIVSLCFTSDIVLRRFCPLTAE